MKRNQHRDRERGTSELEEIQEALFLEALKTKEVFLKRA